MKTPRVVPYLY